MGERAGGRATARAGAEWSRAAGPVPEWSGPVFGLVGPLYGLVGRVRWLVGPVCGARPRVAGSERLDDVTRGSAARTRGPGQ
ncbi:hypothetical protein P3T26_000252 [Streptomyces sp. MAA16]|nr:hypothetical protein [Streptomyces sp. MAA16]